MFRNIFSKFNIAVLLRGKLIKLQHSTLYTAIATQSKIVSLFELRTDCGPKFVQVVIYLTNKTIWTKYKKTTKCNNVKSCRFSSLSRIKMLRKRIEWALLSTVPVIRATQYKARVMGHGCQLLNLNLNIGMYTILSSTAGVGNVKYLLCDFFPEFIA